VVVLTNRFPWRNSMFVKTEVFIRNDKVFIYLEISTKPITSRASTIRTIKRKLSWLKLFYRKTTNRSSVLIVHNQLILINQIDKAYSFTYYSPSLLSIYHLDNLYTINTI